MTPRNIVLWQIHDGKQGHLNQLRGLTNALDKLVSLDVHAIRTPSRRVAIASLWSKQFPIGDLLPRPDIVLGAGHATHLSVLAARRAHGGKAIVLMKPSLPLALFDLCLIPGHDQVVESEKVVVTRGALNVVRPSYQHDPKTGLLLIGGPSATHSWSDERMIEQVSTITADNPTIRWTLTTSRRTPKTFLAKLAERGIDGMKIMPHEITTANWVPEQLAQIGQVWVSADSVSMVYESLTSGAAVGILEVPIKRPGRVARGIETLIDTRWATRFSDWQPGTQLDLPPTQLDEARRCAEIIGQRLIFKASA